LHGKERLSRKRSLLAQRRSDQNSPGPFLLVCEKSRARERQWRERYRRETAVSTQFATVA
jgi:hypothetical protein